jgi:prepilin-type N-terminal cleavage/methylation domain-containing protein
VNRQGAWTNERGFTLVEVLLTIVVMGIVLTIASSSWFGAIESRRVDSATNQVVADLRLAHTQATNRLSDSTFRTPAVPVPGGVAPLSTYQVGPTGELDTKVLLKSDDQGDQETAPQAEFPTATTIVFKADGSAQSALAAGGEVSIKVRSTKDTKKCRTIKVNTTTSRVTAGPLRVVTVGPCV